MPLSQPALPITVSKIVFRSGVLYFIPFTQVGRSSQPDAAVRLKASRAALSAGADGLSASTKSGIVSEKFGVAGMGGSSAQVVFPCASDKCKTARPVYLDGKTKYFYSYSFLGIGGNHERAHGSVRFTFGRFNTKKEIDNVVLALKETIEMLRKISPIKKTEV